MGLWARGPSAEALYEGLALALAGAATDLRTVRPRIERTVTATSGDPVGLAVAFLGQLVTLFQVDGFVLREVRVRLGGPGRRELRATLRGEPFDAERHPRKIEVKAVTFHQAVFDVGRGRARLVIDI
jgi:SHS2 domain-containing protein